MVTINLLFIITVLAGVLGLVDGIARLRGRGGSMIIGIAEIVFSVLLLIALFGALPVPFGLLTWALLLELALVLGLFVGGRVRRGGLIITVIALVLNTIVVLVTLDWLHVPGLF
jgi:hypothetical protein